MVHKLSSASSKNNFRGDFRASLCYFIFIFSYAKGNLVFNLRWSFGIIFTSLFMFSGLETVPSLQSNLLAKLCDIATFVFGSDEPIRIGHFIDLRSSDKKNLRNLIYRGGLFVSQIFLVSDFISRERGMGNKPCRKLQ